MDFPPTKEPHAIRQWFRVIAVGMLVAFVLCEILAASSTTKRYMNFGFRVCLGIIYILVSYRLIGERAGDDAEVDEWHRKGTGVLAFLGAVTIVASLSHFME